MTEDGALPPDDYSDQVRRGQVFLLDRRARGGAVFLREETALLGQDHPAKTPPIGQHALIANEVITLFGREDARMRLVQRIEEQMILGREQLVADVVDGV